MDSVPLTNEMMDQPPRNFYLNLHLRGLARLEQVVLLLLPQMKVGKNVIMGTRMISLCGEGQKTVPPDKG